MNRAALTLFVTPAPAGAQSGKVQRPASLGPGLRRDDDGTVLLKERGVMMLRAFWISAMTMALLACAERDAEAAIKRQLIDPSSAEFTSVGSKGDYVCGLVNSKNRLGGYVGPTGFMVRNGADVTLLGVDEIPPIEFAKNCPSDSHHEILMTHLGRYNASARGRNEY